MRIKSDLVMNEFDVSVLSRIAMIVVSVGPDARLTSDCESKLSEFSKGVAEDIRKGNCENTYARRFIDWAMGELGEC